MTRGSWCACSAGDPLQIVLGRYAYTGKPHPQTTLELEALAGLLGEARAAELVAGEWRLEHKAAAAGKPWGGGSFGVVVSAIDPAVSLRVHREDLRLIEPERRPAPAPRPQHLRVVVPHPVPAACEPPDRKPWADDERVGSIYVSRQADGSCRVALVMTTDGKAKQVQASSGLLPEDVDGAIELCARRLAAEVRRRASAQGGQTGAPASGMLTTEGP